MNTEENKQNNENGQDLNSQTATGAGENKTELSGGVIGATHENLGQGGQSNASQQTGTAPPVVNDHGHGVGGDNPNNQPPDQKKNQVSPGVTEPVLKQRETSDGDVIKQETPVLTRGAEKRLNRRDLQNTVPAKVAPVDSQTGEVSNKRPGVDGSATMTFGEALQENKNKPNQI